jgi:hypothetical protein
MEFIPMRLSLSVASLALVATSLSAQYGGEGPLKISAPTPYPKIDKTTIGTAIGGLCYGVEQINFSWLSGTQHYCCLTYSYNGSVTGTAVVAGTWDTSTELFTKIAHCDAFNALSSPNLNPFALAVSKDLLVAVFDTAGVPFVATRTSTTVPFGTPVAITGIPAGGYLDSMLGTVNGALKYYYVNGQDIWAGDINPATGLVTNSVRVITNPTGYAGAHSPSVVKDASNDSRALLFAANLNSNADAFYTSSLEDLAAKNLLVDWPAWINNGGNIGGSIYYADSTGNYQTNGVLLWNMTMTASVSVPSAGGQVALTSWAPYQKNTNPPYIAGMLIGALGTGPIPIPGIQGNLGLGLSPLIGMSVPNYAHDNGISQLTLNIPPLPMGTRIDLQNVMGDLLANTVYLGNTAHLFVK